MILNNDQLRARAHEFALTHELTSTGELAARFWPGFNRDLATLHEFAKLLQNYNVDCKQPAEDWLLDHINFIETQAQVVYRELPNTKLKRLPKLKTTGLPRIYAVCNDYLDQMNGHYDVDSFENYIMSFQEVSVLKDSECWTLLSAMRVVIIRRLAEAMREVRKRHDVCHSITSFMKQIGSKNMTDSKIRALLEQKTRKKPLDPVEIVHFVQHLSEWEPNIRIVHDWLAVHIETSESSLEQMVSFEHELQAELQVICGNLVKSLHTLERLPWRLSFTKISHIEKILLSDPNNDYKRLDIASRDLLRGRVAKIAEQLNIPETLVAQTSIRLAKSRLEDADADQTKLIPREACLSYYLLDPHGTTILRGELSKLARPRRLPHLAIRRQPSLVYFLSFILLFVGLMLVSGRWTTYGSGVRPISWLAIFAALFLPISEWVITILHEVISKCCHPTPLLRYDFSNEVSEDARTIVVMPVIWSSKEEVDDVVNQLLVHYLANRQKNLHFGILADFCDAHSETMPGDGEILSHALDRIDELQQQYGTDKFFLFHRSRVYNSVDRVYMGWERKRGKLVEFVELLSGNNHTSYKTILGETTILQNIKYIFTTDHDTLLPIGVVSRLAGTIHFPYNRPRLNHDETRVIEGFGVLQPRIGVSFESTQSSRFAALWAGEPGIDPYAFAVSDVYQDFFSHAIFVGKGIFDVEAFRKTLVDRIPDHSVLSHDLLEGGFLRTGLVSDIEVVESYPKTYYAYEQRAHRWIRGDWQLLKWLGIKCEDRHGESKQIALCSLTRWQIVDNLRRSLRAPIYFLVAILGLFALPGRSWVWETIVLLTIFLPFLRALASAVMGRRLNRSLGVSFMQCALQFITLPFSAVLSADAIIRSLYRMYVSRRNLLEWVPSAWTDRDDTTKHVFMFEPAGYIVSVLFAVVAWLSDDIFVRAIGVAALILWLLARPIIQKLNQPQKPNKYPWMDAAGSQLRELASQIWSFYERYVTEDESWLPPDNVQYHPQEIIAHRTSPTNIGLYLACVVAARDLDFIDTSVMVKRIEASVKTVVRMEKWNGHLLNWYDTESAQPLLPKYVSTVDSGNFVAYLMVVRQGLAEWGKRESDFKPHIDSLNKEINELIEQTNFQSLYNQDERLFSLGYHLDSNQKDTILYDLLASEARQASFVAIALGQIPVSHWFSLGRTMTISGKDKTLLSWSGTMFEYLMPSLIMRTYKNTIWDSTYRGVVRLQQMYADQFQVPFGISESGYYAFDYQMNYQYRAFGIPGLGFDRGLEHDLVLAPYATIMALPYAGNAGLSALKRFEDLQAKGDFGYYEAVDFTSQRLSKGSRYQVVQSYMAHHQGMSMLTLCNLLANDIMINRFHSDARICTTDMLLQERLPDKAALIEEPIGIYKKFTSFEEHFDSLERNFYEPTLLPEVNILSNGRMTSINTNNGTGMLTWNGIAVTRWREDPVVDTSGMMIYIHEFPSEETWSTSRFPCNAIQDTKAVFRLDKTSYEGEYQGISSNLEITISPNVDAEIRRLQLVNNSDQDRVLEVTTFLELAMANPSAVNAHPAFNKLFIETSHDAASQCLLAKRRPREDKEQETWAVHTVYVDTHEVGDYEFETDRAKFIGRGYSLKEPKALFSRLRGLTGSVVDPAFVMRRRIQLAPKESATVYIVTGVAESRDKALDIIHQLSEPKQSDNAFHLALVRSQIDLRHLHLTPEQAMEAYLLAGRLLFTPPLTSLRQEAIEHNRLGQSALWPYGVSGDVPIVVVTIKNMADLPFVLLITRQHQYLCMLGLEIDLVVLDETIGGYQDQLMNRLRDEMTAIGIGQMKRMIGLKASQLDENVRTLLKAVARVWLRAGGPSLKAQLHVEPMTLKPLKRQPAATQKGIQKQLATSITPIGEFFNGWGGFIEDGQAYQLFVQNGSYLPRPWSNILANPRFGCLITDFGTGYSWWHNSRECKLTPWTNDPVLDQPGECLYLRDLVTGKVWSATPKPAGAELTYKVTHGKGFSRFEQLDGEITHTMDTVVPLDDTLKVVQLRIRNSSKVQKQISITYYAEWVLGVTREAQAPFIVTEWDKDHKALLAHNAYQETFSDAVSFMHISIPGSKDPSEQLYSWTGNRAEFIGHGGSLESPAALFEKGLSNRTGSFSNTCGAIQTVVEIPPEDEITVTILFGCAASKSEVYSLIGQYGRPSSFNDTLTSVKRYWQNILGQVQVKSPDRSMDIMMNGWLLYQTLACRLWARTAFYQAGGAFGFRDQLQDSLAFLHADPSITRKQILINAAHQYQEGDVQHWWHEETHKGIRTKFSDDLLWLPYTVSRYLEQTGDYEILKENVPFIKSDVLKDEELERYEDTVVSEEKGTVLEHCLRAIRHSLKFGEHGIPLMGIGDWNDGMSRIGAQGRGESVWLGWFLLEILNRFIRLEGDILSPNEIEQFEETARQLENNLNHNAWDGSWFRRAFTDAGTWIGTNRNKECRIDAIAQSWSVLSKGTSEDRQSRAMASFDRELVDRDLSLAKLLTKPFNETSPSPGYIQGYPPGIRENGGQYTHGVIWGIVAWAMLNRRDKAFELFSMLNPITHTRNFRDVQTYENEPYVMSADVYTATPHQGRAGWSWYTGAAGWMYQAGLEYVLGVKLQGDQLYIQPCVPAEWDSYTIDYKYRKTTYSLKVYCKQDLGIPVKWLVDGKDAGKEPYLKLVDDGQVHLVEVHLGLQHFRPQENRTHG
ncbi:glucoamylase family protein [Pullulanibacillus sp. KACC 23026]|uniref:GH36-type glycosyl hydrolase domain-containing protein n=1 Tax=Pullulanibacillus sp. KACC 23026 TaxID=3028315 RepID=UPI0023B1EAD6|nr:glucoamylase family protein [Pullulanibacillus sp. KACC 23026]WEG14527.1 glucoamylase family protein [Pullulanibacillus sp. KACC 23026]